MKNSSDLLNRFRVNIWHAEVHAEVGEEAVPAEPDDQLDSHFARIAAAARESSVTAGPRARSLEREHLQSRIGRPCQGIFVDGDCRPTSSCALHHSSLFLLSND